MNYRRIVWYSLLVSLPLLFYHALPITHDPMLYLWLFSVITFAYFSSVLVFTRAKRPRVAPMEEEHIEIRNDIAHFREVVDKAINENPVAQREVELRLLEMVSMDLNLRYEISPRMIRERMGDARFLSQYLGDAGKIIADMFDRRHELKLSIPRDRFIKEVNEVLEAMK